MILCKTACSVDIQLVNLIVSAGVQLVQPVLRQSECRRYTVLDGFRRNGDHVDALLNVKLSRPAVLQSVIIVHTVGNIAVLLCLQDQKPALDGVDGSRINLDKISLFHRNLADKFAPASLVDHGGKLLFRLRIVTDHERGVLGRIHNVPALRLAERTVFMFLCIGVIRVYLNTQIRLRIDDLCQKREAVVGEVPKYLRVLLPHF